MQEEMADISRPSQLSCVWKYSQESMKSARAHKNGNEEGKEAREPRKDSDICR